uniref:Uncharacterized protein n=1 Tax=Romanomermis culicivorax TaxID=13658 RepID=A0A915HY09_ROMCU
CLKILPSKCRFFTLAHKNPCSDKNLTCYVIFFRHRRRFLHTRKAMLSRYFLRTKQQIPDDGLRCTQNFDDVCRFCNENTDRALVLICSNFICGNCLVDFRSTGSLSLTCTVCYSLTIVPALENHSDKICRSHDIPSDVFCSSCDRFIYAECVSFPSESHKNHQVSNMLASSNNKPEKYRPLMASCSSSFDENVNQLHPLLKAKFYDLQKSLDYCSEFSDHLSQKSRDELSKIDQSIDNL